MKRICLIGMCLLLGLGLLACGEVPQAAVQATLAVTALPLETPVSVQIATAAPEATQAPKALPASAATAHMLDGVTIGIDPGHQQTADAITEPNAPDSAIVTAKATMGTRGVVSNVCEYQVNLDVCIQLATLLREAGAAVYLTRTTSDVHLSNRERAQILNDNLVDLAIGVHCNGTDDETVQGAFMLVPSESCTTRYAESLGAAKVIIARYCSITGITMQKHDGLMQRSDLTFFNWCTRPVVCIEMGYLTNPDEDAHLTDTTFQSKMARGIFEGILAYFSDTGTTP